MLVTLISALRVGVHVAFFSWAPLEPPDRRMRNDADPLDLLLRGVRYHYVPKR